MTYIQVILAKSLKENKARLMDKYTDLKNAIKEHCECETLKDFVTVEDENGFIVLRFDDIKLNLNGIYRYGLDENFNVGLIINFYNDDDYISSVVLTHTGKAKIYVKGYDEEFEYDHDDERVPLQILNVSLNSAYNQKLINL
ncbi:hypothetical protein [Atlantibacter sp.]|uniref:hypothetical protein n=1 Tax=Atlantibacter sp. TaxID=1903473 RepID=UPI0028AAB312|nr:hypothetical protein [Atlantibacter sp.]